jgi:hypothetical protein
LKALCGLSDAESGDGVSLARLLTEGQPLAPRALRWHYPHYSNQGGRPGGAVRDGDWKLIEDYETGRRELFDLGRDVKESNNLADKQPSRVEELSVRLAAWRTAVGAQMPTPNPDYGTAEVHGVMLRFEPLPHKDTLGFWTRADDWASWEFVVHQPGEFVVTALVGCGKGSGGSTVEFRAADQVLALKVPKTGGFQEFVPQDLGRLTLKQAGRHRIEVRATSKPGPAVMDLRELKLVPLGRKAD